LEGKQALEINFDSDSGEHFVLYVPTSDLVPARERDPNFTYEELIAENLAYRVLETICHATPGEINQGWL
jgi:hypothetical protein